MSSTAPGASESTIKEKSLEEAGEQVASVLTAASGSKTVAAPKLLESK